MDSQGYVFLSVIASFNRIRQLTTDNEILKMVCYQSKNIELRLGLDGKERVRVKNGWDKWILTMPERDPSTQNDGPAHIEIPPTPHPTGYDPFFSKHRAPPQHGTYAHFSGAPFQYMNGTAPPFAPPYTDRNGSAPILNGDHGGSHQRFPATVPEYPPGASPQMSSSTEQGQEDAFPDERIDILFVVRRHERGSRKPPFRDSASRTFSHGSLDSSSFIDEKLKADEHQPKAEINGFGPYAG